MLVSLVLVPLVLGLPQVGLILHVRNTLTAAATEGARYGATVDRTPGDGARRTREQVDRALDGYDDAVLAEQDPYRKEREAEVKALLEPAVSKRLEKGDVRVVSFREVVSEGMRG